MCSAAPLPIAVAPSLKIEREKLAQRITDLKSKLKRLPAVNPKGHKATVQPVSAPAPTTQAIRHDHDDSLIEDIVTVGVAAAVIDSVMDDSSSGCCDEHGCSFGGYDSYDCGGGWSSSDSGGGWD